MLPADLPRLLLTVCHTVPRTGTTEESCLHLPHGPINASAVSPVSFRRSVRVAHSWSTHPRAPSSQVSLLCGAHLIGHLSPQQEMTGLAVGPCCTAVTHRTFPAAPFAAPAGDRSMDACARGTIPRTTTPIIVRRGVMMPPPPPPASTRCPQAADPPRASGACLDAPRRQLARTCGAGSEACRLYAVLTVVTRAVGCTTTTNITHEDRWALKVGWASLEILGLIYLIYHMQLLSVF